MSIMIMLIALAFFGGLTIYIAIHLDIPYRIFMLVSYSLAFGILVIDVAAATFGARSTFARVARKFVAKQFSSPLQGISQEIPSGRALSSYLIFPRPEDWIKWLFIPAAFIIASWSKGDGFHWGKMFLTLLIVEYFIYSARYQWNDIRGLKEDPGHPEALARQRLPDSEDKAQRRFIVYTSLSVALFRLAIAILVGYLVGMPFLAWVLIGVIFTVATFYEFLRTAESRTYIDEKPRPAHYAVSLCLWLTVGLGYSVRFLAGLYAAGIPILSPLGYTGASFSFFFGVMFVLLTWVLEATSYCRSWCSKVWYVADKRLRRKPHLMILLRYLSNPTVRFTSFSGAQSGGNCKGKEVLKDRRAARFLAPWNFAYIATAICSALLGAYLSPLNGNPLILWTIIGFGTFGALYVISINAAALREVSWVAIFALLMAGVGLIEIGFDLKRALLLILPWSIATITFIGFRQQSYSALKNFPTVLSSAARDCIERIAKIIIGRQTWTRIK